MCNEPRVSTDGLTIRQLLNAYLTAKQRQLDSGHIVARTFGDYRTCCKRIASFFGVNRLVDDLRADDFERLPADTHLESEGIQSSSFLLQV